MKATVRGAVLLYAVAALLLAAHDTGRPATLAKLCGLAALFYAAYRYNLTVAGTPDDDASGSALSTSRKIAFLFVLLAVMNLLPAAHSRAGIIRDNLAIVLVAAAFFATRPFVREYGFLLAWGAFNAWLLLNPDFSLILAPIFVVAACAHRSAVTAYGLGEKYSCPEHGATRAAGRALRLWTLAALLLFIPLQSWGWRQDQLIHPPLTREERAEQRALVDKAREGFPLQVTVIAFGLLVLAGILWRQLRDNRRGPADNKELQALLAAQGFVRALDQVPAPGRTFPGGARGRVLKLYARLLAAAEKKLKFDLRCCTPAQRETYFRQLDAGRPWHELTAIYNRARYSPEEISDEDAQAAGACARRFS